jgi:hypothetical protein
VDLIACSPALHVLPDLRPVLPAFSIAEIKETLAPPMRRKK